jgi:hypothetical protein
LLFGGFYMELATEKRQEGVITNKQRDGELREATMDAQKHRFATVTAKRLDSKEFITNARYEANRCYCPILADPAGLLRISDKRLCPIGLVV